MQIVRISEKIYKKMTTIGNMRKDQMKADMLHNVRKYFLTNFNLNQLEHSVLDMSVGERMR